MEEKDLNVIKKDILINIEIELRLTSLKAGLQNYLEYY